MGPTRFLRPLVLASLLGTSVYSQETVPTQEYDVEPKLIEKVEPEYPPDAERDGIEGDVVLLVRIDTDGSTTHLRTLRPLRLCTEAAITAGEKWIWEPALKDGEPVPAEGVIVIHFQPAKPEKKVSDVAQWVSAIGTALGFALAITLAIVALRRHSVARVLDFDRIYKTHRPHLATFWDTARQHFKQFRHSHDDLPEDLDAFIRQVGLPPRLPPKTTDIRNWRTENADRLSPMQTSMLVFVSDIYPERQGRTGPVETHSAINPDAAAKVFHEARGELAWFWNNEAWHVSPKHLRENHPNGRDLLTIISWLEIALHEWTDTHGLGKVRLFEVAAKTWQPRRSRGP